MSSRLRVHSEILNITWKCCLFHRNRAPWFKAENNNALQFACNIVLQMNDLPLFFYILSTFLLFFPLLFLFFYSSCLTLLFFIYCLRQKRFLTLNQEHLYGAAAEPHWIWKPSCNYMTLFTIYGLSMPCLRPHELIYMGRFQGLLPHVEFLLWFCCICINSGF